MTPDEELLCAGLAGTMVSEAYWRADGDFRVTAEDSAAMTLYAIVNYLKYA